MKTFLRTQVVSILFGIGWVVYLNILTLLNDPNKGTILHIDKFIWLLVISLTLINIVIVKSFIGRKWIALPLIILPYLFVYQHLFPGIQRAIGIGSNGYYLTFDFNSLQTAHIVTFSFLIATILGIMLARKENT